MCTFTPKIDERSRTLTGDFSRSRGGMAGAEDDPETLASRTLRQETTERLHADFEKTQHKLSKLRRQHERAKKKDPECTFAPTLKVRDGYKGKGERSADEAHRAEPKITARKEAAMAERLYSTHEQTQARKTAQIKKRDEMIKKTGAEFSEASRFLAEFGWDVERASKEFFKTRPRWGAGGTRITAAQKQTSADRLSKYNDPRRRSSTAAPSGSGTAASGFGCSVPSTRLHPSSGTSSSRVTPRVSRLSEEVEGRLHSVPQHRQTESRKVSTTPRLSQSQSQRHTGPPTPVGSRSGATSAAAPVRRKKLQQQTGSTAAEESAAAAATAAAAAAAAAAAVAGMTLDVGSIAALSPPGIRAKQLGGARSLEDGVREILTHFYEKNHPEFASAEKIDEFVGYYKQKAAGAGEPEQWSDLLWSAYEGQGVNPREDYRVYLEQLQQRQAQLLQQPTDW